jgi:hypothetical protein
MFRKIEESAMKTRKGASMGSESCTVVLQLRFQGRSFDREFDSDFSIPSTMDLWIPIGRRLLFKIYGLMAR